MTDKERMLEVLQTCEEDILEGILFCYLDRYGKNISVTRLCNLINTLNNDYLIQRIYDLETVRGE